MQVQIKIRYLILHLYPRGVSSTFLPHSNSRRDVNRSLQLGINFLLEHFSIWIWRKSTSDLNWVK